MKKQILVVLMGAVLATPFVACAEGAYVGVGAGRGEQKLSFDELGTFKENDTAYKLFGGYDFHRNFGVEAGYAILGEAKASYEEGGDSGTIKGKTKSFYLAAIGKLPLNEQFSLFAKAGVAFNRTKVKEDENGVPLDSESFTETTPLFGIGAAYNFSNNVALTVEYEDFGKVLKVEDVTLKSNILTVGLRYTF